MTAETIIAALPDTFSPLGLGWRAVVQDRRVRVSMTKIRRSAGSLTAYVEVEYASDKAEGRWNRLVLAGERLNISSGRERSAFANRIEKRAPGTSFNWLNVIDAICIEVHRRDDEGEQEVMIGNLPPATDGGWQIEGLLERNQSHSIFGDGSVGKSWVALAAATSQASGYEVLPGYRPVHRGAVLYVDYETDYETMNARVKQISRGVGFDPPDLVYLRLDQPFSDCLERVLQLCQKHEVILVIIDSVEAAMAGSTDPGGGANDGPARMNQALRRLQRTSLLIDHVNAEQAKSKALAGRAYGSIFKRNWVRMSFELKQMQDGGEGEHHLGMFNTKRNNGRLFDPVGLRWTVNDEVSSWSREQIDVQGFGDALPAWQRIAGTLRVEGPKTLPDIVEATGLSKGTVSSALSKRTELFERLPGGLWQLLADHPPPVVHDELPWDT